MKGLTANRLIDGEVVFWNAGRWTERFAEVQMFDDAAEAEAAEAHAKAQPTIVVDPYLMDLVETEGMWIPVAYRDRLRALGPTNHVNHGKQSEGGKVVETLQHAHTAARSTGRINLIKRK